MTNDVTPGQEKVNCYPLASVLLDTPISDPYGVVSLVPSPYIIRMGNGLKRHIIEESSMYQPWQEMTQPIKNKVVSSIFQVVKRGRLVSKQDIQMCQNMKQFNRQ